VLIVDDDDDLRSDLKVFLSSEFEINTASGTKRAMELLDSYRPDCLLLDLCMPQHFGDNPRFEGLSFLKHLRAYMGRGTDDPIPVIIITARRENDFQDIARAWGADAHYRKPLDIKKLKASIWDLVSMKGEYSS
jgi:two-component system response regulator ResD